LAIAGLVYLLVPGVTAPDLMGCVLMAIAGIAWGFYSLLGRTARDPLAATAGAFIYCVPAVLAVSLAADALGGFHATAGGLALAVASGAVASGCGYVIWYAALPGLGATRAATVQLSVPVIAAFGGVLLLSEELTLRLALAAAATLGGVTIVLAQRAKTR
jgi:drug/metabolite transporter (DMT)-like permease